MFGTWRSLPRTLLVTLAGLGLVGTLRAQPTEWDFSVLLDGKPIGSHRFRVAVQGAETDLVSEADLKVTVLAIPFYRYRHVSRESFEGDCLQTLDATTEENGASQQVHGSLGGSAFMVRTAHGAAELPACVMTFAYWNPHMLLQTHLLNPQTGAYLPVVVTRLATEQVTVGGRSQAAMTYLLAADTMKIKLWYSAGERWLGLESSTRDGHRMRYQLQ